MVSTDIAYINFDRTRSNHGAINVVKQHRFLTNLIEKLKTEVPTASCSFCLSFAAVPTIVFVPRAGWRQGGPCGLPCLPRCPL
jgi:hypothetical protein